MNLSTRFLDSYDECKQTRTVDECRNEIINAVPAAVSTYLVGYDTCLKVFPQSTCRRWFAPAKAEDGTPGWVWLIGGCLAAYLALRMLK